MTLETAAGDARFRMVGIADEPAGERDRPLRPAHDRARCFAPAGVNTYWIKTNRPEHAAVDRTVSRLEDRLDALGHQMGGEIKYVAEQNEIADNRRSRPRSRCSGPDRGDEHGRARERDHHQRHRAHPRDRHPPQHRRTRPRRPADLRHRRRRLALRRLAARHPARLRARRACWYGWSGKSSACASPVVFPRWNIRSRSPERSSSHSSIIFLPVPPRRPLPARRRAPLRLTCSETSSKLWPGVAGRSSESSSEAATGSRSLRCRSCSSACS